MKLPSPYHVNRLLLQQSYRERFYLLDWLSLNKQGLGSSLILREYAHLLMDYSHQISLTHSPHS